MIKAYHPQWVQNMHIQRQAAEWKAKNLLTEAQEAQIKTAYPEHFYRPGIFVKIGLFCFAVVACAFFAGFFTLFVYDTGSELGLSTLSLLCAGCFLFMLEMLIRERKLFHSGVDNALLYAAVCAAIVPVFLLFKNAPLPVYCLLALVIIIPATLRYADLLGPVAIFGLIFTILADLMLDSSLGKALLPFGIMIVAGLIYFLVKQNDNIYYRECRQMLEVLALVTCYLGGNYLVVREANAIISGLNASVAPQIAFAPLFYGFTMAIPIAYIAAGIRKADRMLLIVGLLAFAFSAYTFAHYFSPLTASQEFVLAGVLMIGLSAALIKYLHTPKHGLSDERNRRNSLANLEALVAAQQLGVTHQDGGLEFGGGEFGGGGAGEVY